MVRAKSSKKWMLPGGYIDRRKREVALDGAVRELHEELGFGFPGVDVSERSMERLKGFTGEHDVALFRNFVSRKTWAGEKEQCWDSIVSCAETEICAGVHYLHSLVVKTSLQDAPSSTSIKNNVALYFDSNEAKISTVKSSLSVRRKQCCFIYHRRKRTEQTSQRTCLSVLDVDRTYSIIFNSGLRTFV